METLLLTLSPIVVAFISQGVKWFINHGTTISQTSVLHTAFLRFLVAVLSFGTVITSAILSNQQVEMTAISTFADAFLVFLGATGMFFLAKKKE